MASFAGAVILADQKKTVLFKNRDLSSTKQHEEKLFYDVDCMGIKGIDSVTGESGGIAIGVNRHGLAVANTHVRNTEDPSYHLLTEQILMFAKDAEDGLKMIRDHLKTGRKYQWGNLILADHDSVLAVEIAADEHSIEQSERKVLRTSHHILLDTEEGMKEYGSSLGEDYLAASETRLNRGYDLLREITSVRDVFNLLKDHGDTKGQASLCKHAGSDNELATRMSYVVEIDNDPETGRPKVVFHFAKGNPCEVEYKNLPLIFPADDEIVKRAEMMYFK